MNIDIIHKEELEDLDNKSVAELFSLLSKNCSNRYFITENPYKKLLPDYVIDEDKSVKWNREQVEVNNKNWEEYQNQGREENARINNIIEDAIIHNLMDNYGFNYNVAYKVFHKAYGEWYDMLIDTDMEFELEKLADFVAEILKTPTE